MLSSRALFTQFGRRPMIRKPNPESIVERGTLRRRGFLGGVAAGALVSIAHPAMAESPAHDIAQDRTRARYRESEGVKTFYRVNRYPGQKG
jgi:hypothetical protein